MSPQFAEVLLHDRRQSLLETGRISRRRRVKRAVQGPAVVVDARPRRQRSTPPAPALVFHRH
ncbi:MAG: hypothetical protein WKF43_09815 [Acidimicrobiales bacterium]